jgi:hypothetical protein
LLRQLVAYQPGHGLSSAFERHALHATRPSVRRSERKSVRLSARKSPREITVPPGGGPFGAEARTGCLSSPLAGQVDEA